MKWVPRSDTDHFILLNAAFQRDRHFTALYASASVHACHQSFGLRSTMMTNTYLQPWMLKFITYENSIRTTLLGLFPCSAVAIGLGILPPMRGMMQCIQLWTNSVTSCFIAFHRLCSLVVFSVALLPEHPANPQWPMIFIFSLSLFASFGAHINLFIINCFSEFLLVLVGCSEWSWAPFISSWPNPLIAPAAGTMVRYNAAIFTHGSFYSLHPLDHRVSRSAKKDFFLSLWYIVKWKCREWMAPRCISWKHIWENLVLALALPIQTIGLADQNTHDQDLAPVIGDPCDGTFYQLQVLPSRRLCNSVLFLWTALLRTTRICKFAHQVLCLHILLYTDCVIIVVQNFSDSLIKIE